VKIIYDPQIFSLQEYGGISRYFAELATHLYALDGTDIEVCSPWYASRHLTDAPRAILNIKAAIPARSHFGYSRHLFTAANMVLFKKRLRAKSFDIAHHTYYWPLPDHLPVRARVTTVHDMIDDIIVPNRRKSHFKRQSVRQADRVICVSEHTRNALIECYGIAPEKTSVVHLGKPDAPALADAPVVLPPCPYVLYVGERGGYKNFVGLVRAFAASARIRQDFQLVCFGGRPLSADEMSAWTAYGLAPDRLKHCAGNDGTLHALYCGASLFVYPSLYEGFGLPPLEAMAMGTPVACSDASSIPEVVGEAGEYFDPRCTDSITQAMESVLYSEMRRHELISLGRERSARFSWDRCARETLAIYRTLT